MHVTRKAVGGALVRAKASQKDAEKSKREAERSIVERKEAHKHCSWKASISLMKSGIARAMDKEIVAFIGTWRVNRAVAAMDAEVRQQMQEEIEARMDQYIAVGEENKKRAGLLAKARCTLQIL